MFSQCPIELILADALLGHMLVNDGAIVHQQRRLPFNKFAETAVLAGKDAHRIVQEQQSRGGDRAAGQRRIRPVIAFWTELLIKSKSVRSKGVICPTSRLPLKRTPTNTRM